MYWKLIFFVIVLVQSSLCEEYVLTKILALSRHNVRTPLSNDIAKVTPHVWPKWSDKNGYLTAKGAVLEGLMGEYFYQWLTGQSLLPDGCPKGNDVYVYANTKQRTLASANAFVEKAFSSCNVTVHRSEDTEEDEMDPIFNPVIHNATAAFKELVLNEMKEHLKTLDLNASYEELSNILNYKESQRCKEEGKCNLITEGSKPIIELGEKPLVKGPLKLGNSIADTFTMEYYEGFPLKDVAWGKLNNKKQWVTLLELNKAYHNVIFNNTLAPKDIAGPLLQFISDKIFKEDFKFTLIVGHDANMYTILNSLGFKPYILNNQYEKTPVGGKIVFQKWHDLKADKDFVKINYVYQSTKQIRKSLKLDLDNPPQFELLELVGCKSNEQGFCPWSDFKKIFDNLLKPASNQSKTQ